MGPLLEWLQPAAPRPITRAALLPPHPVLQFADPASFVFATALVGAVTACMLVVAHAGLERTLAPLLLWVGGDLALTTHRVLTLLQPGVFGAPHAGLGLLAEAPLFAVTTPFIVLGVVLHTLALARLAGRPLSVAGYAVALPLLLGGYALTALLLDGMRQRVELLFAVVAALALWQVAMMWPLVRGSRGAKIIAAIAGGIALSNLAIMALWAVQPPHLPEPAAGLPRFAPMPALVVDFVSSLFLSFGFALLLQERVRQHIVQLSTTDRLTAALNRHGMVPVLSHEWQRATRYDRPMAVAMLDLDHFKRVNDAHGHAAGDQVLAAFARRIAQLKRSPDRLARWGGEEFLLVMPETSAADAWQAVERMRVAVAAQPLVPGLPAITFSAGVVGMAPGGAEPPSIDGLLAAADRRLYAAKATRNCVVGSDAHGRKRSALAGMGLPTVA